GGGDDVDEAVAAVDRLERDQALVAVAPAAAEHAGFGPRLDHADDPEPAVADHHRLACRVSGHAELLLELVVDQAAGLALLVVDVREPAADDDVPVLDVVPCGVDPLDLDVRLGVGAVADRPLVAGQAGHGLYGR